MSVFIRHAVVEDIPWMIGELKDFSIYYGSEHSLYPDDEYARAGIYKMINEHLVLVAENGKDGPVGFIAGVVHGHLYNPKIKVLTEMWWWVSPSQRRGKSAIMLLDAFIAWGKKHCNWITMSLTEKTAVGDKHITKRGFKDKERCFLMEVK